MRRTLPLTIAAAATTLAATAAVLAPAHAITNGELDNGAHPMVGMMSAQTEDGEPLWRCSGTLISPTVFITAGHCTSDDEGGSVGNVELWFGDGPYPTNPLFLEDVADFETAGDPSCEDDETGERYDGYPCTGEYSGEAFTHPSYDPDAFWLWDLGVVRLDEAVAGVTEFGTLPEVGAYDDWAPSREQTFTSVGYGLQKARGQGATSKNDAEKVRMVSHPRLVLANRPYVGDYNMQLSNNARTGGTCSGDSGGPNFLDDTFEIVGVTSYGMSMQTCGGLGGLYRLDREEDRPWLLCVVNAATNEAAEACTLEG